MIILIWTWKKSTKCKHELVILVKTSASLHYILKSADFLKILMCFFQFSGLYSFPKTGNTITAGHLCYCSYTTKFSFLQKCECSIVSDQIILDSPYKGGLLFSIKFAYLWLFSITDSFNLPEWCHNILKPQLKHNKAIPAYSLNHSTNTMPTHH